MYFPLLFLSLSFLPTFSFLRYNNRNTHIPYWKISDNIVRKFNNSNFKLIVRKLFSLIIQFLNIHIEPYIAHNIIKS